ncbi:hypothetical protein LTR78_010918 [Recurvomyces mirabilis]|uniref:Uncharacterized protein n=1 Tax=Recurvomyces mirabilis TaxID=574656 RepID=A0AAE0WG02_9PEZI|nr:hypothetical protein LTR78_010918 [Recurvomyces mirabilis]KAK5149550.1 hypothetical protein LTS14_010844 [Recurvomyces mirabilis]
MYGDLYQLVNLAKGDWVPQQYDELLRERMEPKMGQFPTKMQRTDKIVGSGDMHHDWRRAEALTDEIAGEAIGDEMEVPDNVQPRQSARKSWLDIDQCAHVVEDMKRVASKLVHDGIIQLSPT